MTQENNQKQMNKEEQASRGTMKPSFWKSFFAKRWTYPVIYLGSAALIIGLMYAKSQDAFPFSKSKNVPQDVTQGSDTQGTPSLPTAATQQLIWPIGEDGQNANVTMNFFDDSKDKAAQAASLLKYDKTFYTQNGIVMGLKNDKPFTVVSAASGKVTRVEDNPLLGKGVEITHDNGYVTYYASLSQVDVKEGQAVLQGEPIGKSGNNKLEASQKNHLHFEVKKDNKNLDPISLLPARSDASAATQGQPQAQPQAVTPADPGNQTTTDHAGMNNGQDSKGQAPSGSPANNPPVPSGTHP